MINPLQMIAEDLARFYADPFGYVMWCFPWGEKGTPLEQYSGPRQWQKDFLIDLGNEIKARGFNGINPVTPIQESTGSGHGIGKSALSAFLIKFILDTRPFSKGCVTANTSDQLKTKTWGELGKWHNMSLTKQFFTYNSGKGSMTLYNNQYPEIWRCDALTCREENSEAFAGLHASNSTPFYLFDEGSAVPEKIYEVAQGGLTDGEPMFFIFGNPTRNTGFFRETFGKYKHRWKTRQIDSRDVEGTNKELFQSWINDYGLDSDFVKVRVRGIFPSSSVCQFISSELVEKAMGKHLHESLYSFAPKCLGVDVSYFGDDRSAIFLRQGLRSSLLWQGYDIDTMRLAGLVGQYEDEYKTDATFVDVTGVGAGVVDRLRQLGRNPMAVQFAASPIKQKYKNKRAECWGEMKDWLESGGVIPELNDLRDDLISPEYFFDSANKIQLESKADMKKRGLASPDLADGLALTFAQPVYKAEGAAIYSNDSNRCETEYNLF